MMLRVPPHKIQNWNDVKTYYEHRISIISNPIWSISLQTNKSKNHVFNYKSKKHIYEVSKHT